MGQIKSNDVEAITVEGEKLNSEINQIFYGSWYDKVPEEHKGYFGKIDTIAQWISAMLEFGKRYGREIDIFQWKEKYGTACVYCSFECSPGNTQTAFWYRKVYLDAKRLWPEYWYAISASADYREYLYETEEEFLASVDYVHSYRHGDLGLIYEVCGWEKKEEKKEE